MRSLMTLLSLILIGTINLHLQTEIQKMAQKEKAGLLTEEDRLRQIPFNPNAGKTVAKLTRSLGSS